MNTTTATTRTPRQALAALEAAGYSVLMSGTCNSVFDRNKVTRLRFLNVWRDGGVICRSGSWTALPKAGRGFPEHMTKRAGEAVLEIAAKLGV